MNESSTIEIDKAHLAKWLQNILEFAVESECRCGFAIMMVGDGCVVCQPRTFAEKAVWNLAEDLEEQQ